MYWLHFYWTGWIIMKFLNFLRGSGMHQNYQSKLWLARFRPMKTKLLIQCKPNNSKWPSMHCTVSSNDLHHWLKPSVCALSWHSCPSLTETVFAGWDVFTLKICLLCCLLALRWHNVWKADQPSLFLLQMRLNNDTARETLDKWKEPEVSQSLVMAD